MLNFIRRLLVKTKTSPQPVPEALISEHSTTPEQLAAIDEIVQLVYRHLSTDQQVEAIQNCKALLIAGQSLHEALAAQEEGSSVHTYLEVDLRDSESAVGFAQDLFAAHRLAQSSLEEQAPASDILKSFDALLQPLGYRFLSNRSVDWHYAGLVLPTGEVHRFISLAAILKSQFEAGAFE